MESDQDGDNEMRRKVIPNQSQGDRTPETTRGTTCIIACTTDELTATCQGRSGYDDSEKNI